MKNATLIAPHRPVDSQVVGEMQVGSKRGKRKEGSSIASPPAAVGSSRLFSGDPEIAPSLSNVSLDIVGKCSASPHESSLSSCTSLLFAPGFSCAAARFLFCRRCGVFSESRARFGTQGPQAAGNELRPEGAKQGEKERERERARRFCIMTIGRDSVPRGRVTERGRLRERGKGDSSGRRMGAMMRFNHIASVRCDGLLSFGIDGIEQRKEFLSLPHIGTFRI